ncbi:hypothetical protein Pcinc_034015 [Petrolisthes cinctipes]|uniref:Uncharacterized protein n=1 Tax=Petrolisthes cinctipes TaxID=88211 RepID=A0AAE1ER20_PETCI|nr:hypothetical protein Pcinc_034015 [Petrolisthes cinctipes]
MESDLEGQVRQEGDVPSLLKAKDFLKDPSDKMERMEAVNIGVEVLKEKIDYKTNEFKEAVWEQMKKRKPTDGQISIKGMEEAQATDPVKREEYAYLTKERDKRNKNIEENYKGKKWLITRGRTEANNFRAREDKTTAGGRTKTPISHTEKREPPSNARRAWTRAR